MTSRARSFAILAALSASAWGCTPTPRAAVRSDFVVAESTFKGTLVGVDTKTGKATFRLPADGWADAPPMADGKVFLHGEQGVAARDLATGALAWRQLVQSPYKTSIVVGAGSVFVPVTRGNRQAWVGLAQANGIPSFELACDRWAPLATAGDFVFTIDHERLSAAGGPGGKQRWTSKDDARAPVVGGGSRVLARTGDTEVSVYEAASGEVARRVDLGSDDPMSTSFSRALRLDFDGTRIATVVDGAVVVFDVSTAKRKWASEDLDASGVALSGELVVVVADGALKAFDAASGAPRWSANGGEAELV
ncbi:MAG TPA: PQQ-binding-like beta-propeller repeat protein, partial [Polyangiaceae bacterium]|nr:PQQ-binding-like beta-propeller repeat protein [Polyangiaceae bacterium]